MTQQKATSRTTDKAKPFIRAVEISDIRVDADVQQRAKGTNADIVDSYALEMQNGAKFPPNMVFKTASGELILADGFHRIAAAHQLGSRMVKCEIKKGSRDDAIEFACGANANHGARRTNADKRKAVATLLQLHPNWSARSIARLARVSHEMVNQYQSKDALKVSDSDTCHAPDNEGPQISSSEIAEVRIGRDGKKYPARRPTTEKSEADPIAPTSKAAKFCRRLQEATKSLESLIVTDFIGVYTWTFTERDEAVDVAGKLSELLEHFTAAATRISAEEIDE